MKNASDFVNYFVIWIAFLFIAVLCVRADARAGGDEGEDKAFKLVGAEVAYQGADADAGLRSDSGEKGGKAAADAYREQRAGDGFKQG